MLLVMKMGRHKIKNAGKGNPVEKIKRKIRNKWVSKLRNTSFYKYCYLSYWHSLLVKKDGEVIDKKHMYFSARPNPGAGIGHQMANWIAGYWFAKLFGLHFAHIPFSSNSWEKFLGFYQDEETMLNLKYNGYKIVRIQKFDEYNPKECARIKKIISSYSGQKVVFLAEQDQFYRDQFGVMHEIQKKFYSAPSRVNDRLIFDKNCFNIAIHVRRGDIMESIGKVNSNITMRYQGNEYFIQALKTALAYLKDKENIQIYLFSQSQEKDFPEFTNFDNLHFCLDMGAQESFLHMVYADALITSKSSFSYKPALLSKGLKFCPVDFWHGYPKTDDWILLDENGYIS